tara:strand:+ start:249 stop:461 length:213 start_codon:yes stop_codon:yes gene_type:complete
VGFDPMLGFGLSIVKGLDIPTLAGLKSGLINPNFRNNPSFFALTILSPKPWDRPVDKMLKRQRIDSTALE